MSTHTYTYTGPFRLVDLTLPTRSLRVERGTPVELTPDEAAALADHPDLRRVRRPKTPKESTE
ncbi:hypothetical protein GCM10012275_56320 [Longimycelium tulufanense]|uniref:Uncharacterized protein n=1 Tax=Longimycelium tulufanense TaxID=907463 RepID=A0A8J3CJJ2_9PSEU|nr:hypothetical protein [Longimycelium tulufanense]GGM78438.1 hypothetical protein GCM10012275_56320 [Longimycelium tulufanense]